MSNLPKPTEWFHLSRISFQQTGRFNHEAIVLVPIRNLNQDVGTVYHVTGDLGLGMDFQKKANCRYTEDVHYLEGKTTLLGYVKGEDIVKFEEVLRSVTPPHEPEVLFTRREVLEARLGKHLRDCSEWIDEVIASAYAQKLI